MGHSHPKLVSWAAQDGRVQDLVYHIQHSGKSSLLPSSRSLKMRAPIHMAAVRGHVDCLKVLIDAGSSLEVKDSEGHTPLHLAVANQHYRAVELLLSLKAKPDSKTRFDVTPLHLATSVGNTPCVELLLDHGAFINSQESWGQTPLVISTLRGRLPTMQCLLSHGADSEIVDYQRGQTPLHIACASKDESRVLLLLDAGCNVHTTDYRGYSPLGVAIINKFYAAIPLLLEYGARLNKCERDSLSLPLLNHLDHMIMSIPMSLSRQCRVFIRCSLGPSNLNSDLSDLKLPIHVLRYMQSILEVCDGSNELKKKAVEGVTIVHPMVVQK